MFVQFCPTSDLAAAIVLTLDADQPLNLFIVFNLATRLIYDSDRNSP